MSGLDESERRPKDLIFRYKRDEDEAKVWVNLITKLAPDDAMVEVSLEENADCGKHIRMEIIIPIGDSFDNWDDEE